MSRETDTRHGRRLEYFTLGWNTTEAVVGIFAGIVAESIALIGFGADSIIESLSGGVLFSRERGSRRFTVANESSAWSCRFTAVGANVLPPA
jgi:divalent metal cation (Fe/Co/Zn/Cd) transporter